MKNSSIWQSISRLSQIEEIVENSFSKPQVIFKHSTRCGISRLAKNRMERGWDFDLDQVDLHYLDLLTYRPISNHIAERTGIVHESPQMILIIEGKAVFSASHAEVVPDAIMPFVITA